MGVEYRYLLIPRDNQYRPDVEVVRRLIETWRANNFAACPGTPQHAAMNFHTHSTTYAHAAVTGASICTAEGWRSFEDDRLGVVSKGELILQWPVTNTLEARLKNPLGLVDEVEGTYFNLELHFSDDFVSHSTEMIDPPDARCSNCRKDLEYWPDADADIFYAGRIRQVCPACSMSFRPQDHAIAYRDGITGEEGELKGGATYRFAIVIDCGKSWRTDGSDEVAPVATSEFLEVSSRALGIPLYGVGYFY